MSRRRVVVLAILALLIGGFFWLRYGTRAVPAGQPPLVTLDSTSLAALRADFNRATDHVRIIALLSPT